VFAGGAVVYSNAAKTALLGVGEDLLERHGAVSPECAVALAEGARERFDADLALSVTGIAGPSGGTPLKPVGLVWFGLAERHSSGRAEERRFHGDRATVRARATVHALDLLRTALRR
jgi:nicotinamide-nucleotide amidase